MADEKLVYDGVQECPYLPEREARMPLYRQLRPLDPDEADARFALGERRVGRALYRTQCVACEACEPLRVPVATFKPSKSQRRVLRRWQDPEVRIEVGPATYSEEKLALFNRHKATRGLQRSDAAMTPAGYVGWLVYSCFATLEMRYLWGDRLVGVGVLDVGRSAMSSVYFYFDPEVSDLSPGVFSVLQELELCRRTGRDHLYLGLYVEDCRHLAYKADYGPHERLVGGEWRPRARGRSGSRVSPPSSEER